MMSKTKIFLGFIDKTAVYMFTLTNLNGMTAEVTNFGATIISITVPDSKGKFEDVVLGCDKLENYLSQKSYFGATIGRFSNRIEDSKFEVDGIEYKLAKNDGENHLHGGTKGFDKVVWQAELLNEKSSESLELSYLSKDGEEGYPGNLTVKVKYTLTEENQLKIDYYAICDKDTVVNLTNHSYFNLSGQDSGNILKHKVMINANEFTVNDKNSIPTGEIRTVKGTPMDFTKLTEIGKNISSSYEQITFGKGYDHNWVLDISGKSPEKAAEVYDEETGRVMEVFTTKPGIQFYSGNFLDGSEIGKGGVHYEKRSGLCLETQYFPNSIKHKHFPSPILRAGEEYEHTTIYKFSTRI
ncbi:MAG: galactose mutarotase [Clostridiaceae bacterium]|nr:galactose mutarotase [Clostridiaceae bacterium]